MEKLELLKENSKDLAKVLSTLKSYDKEKVFDILKYYHFDGKSFVEFYTKKFRK